MHEFPHRYAVVAKAESKGAVALSSEGLTTIESGPPPEFGGPGGLWSPETLLVAAVADCFVLSFRAVAHASKLEWLSLDCGVEGVLDKEERVTRFTKFNVSVTLTVPSDVDEAKAQRLLEKAEHVCLITNSLIADSHLTAEVRRPA